MKKLLFLGALVAGLAFVGTTSTAQADHRSCYSGGYGAYYYPSYSYGSYYYPSYRSHYYPSHRYSYSPAWRYYRHGGYYSRSRHHHHRGHYGYRRSGFSLYIGR